MRTLPTLVPLPLIVGVFFSALLGCEGPALYQSHRADSQPEAGTFHFSVVAVAPWESSVRNLQPKFEMTEALALQSVLETTRTVGEEESRTTSSTLAVGEERLRRPRPRPIPSPTFGDSSSDAGDFGGGGDSSDGGDYGGSSDSGSGSSGDASGSDQGSEAPPPRVDAPDVQSVDFKDLLARDPQSLDNLDRSAQGADPLTKYWAASSLFQEVHLLSQSLHYALMRRGYRAYIVRLKLTLLPNARNEPYDAICSLSFFAGGDDGAAPVRLPQVVPILVTDDLERSKHSRRVDNTREIGLALKYLQPLASSGASVSDVMSSAKSVSGTDLNSLFTVTRMTDNTLGVRLGAAQQAASNFAMIPQNHTVSALLLVPEGEGAHMEVVADARFIDTETGAELPQQAAGVRDSEIQRVLLRAGLPLGDSASRSSLLAATRWNDWQSFRTTLKGVAEATAVPRRSQLEAWQQLAMVAARSGLSVTTFDLPTTVAMTEAVGQGAQIGVLDQQAVASDDGTRTIIRVRTGELPFDSVAVGVLRVPAASGAPVELLPTSIHFDPVDQQLELAFDSLGAWGADPNATSLPLELKLNGRSTTLNCQYRSAAGVPMPSLDDPSANLAAPPAEPPK